MKLLLSGMQFVVCANQVILFIFFFFVSVAGSTTSSSLLFVFPGIFYLKISNEPLKSFDSMGVNTQTNETLLNPSNKNILSPLSYNSAYIYLIRFFPNNDANCVVYALSL